MTTENEDRIQRVAIDIQTAKRWKKRHETLLNLEKLKGFQDIVLEGYFKEEAARLVGLVGEPEMQSEEQQRYVKGAILAVSNLRQYLMDVHKLGRTAEHTLKHDAQTQQDLLAKGLDGTD